MAELGDRIGKALLRAPFAWLITTFAVVLIMTTSLSGIAEEVGEGSSSLAILASAFAVLEGAVAFFVVPRTVLTEVRRRGPEGQAVVIRWAFAMVPFVVTYAAVAAGAEVWALSVGIFISAVLLIQWARAAGRAN